MGEKESYSSRELLRQVIEQNKTQTALLTDHMKQTALDRTTILVALQKHDSELKSTMSTVEEHKTRLAVVEKDDKDAKFWGKILHGAQFVMTLVTHKFLG